MRLLPSVRVDQLDPAVVKLGLPVVKLDSPVALLALAVSEEEVSPVRRGDAVLRRDVSRGLVRESPGLSLLVMVGWVCEREGAEDD